MELFEQIRREHEHDTPRFDGMECHFEKAESLFVDIAA